MSRRSLAPLRDEDGQSLVLVVFSLFGLVIVLALVVDVGMWIRAQRQAQGVADAAALAAAQELPDVDDAIDVRNAYAQANWPAGDVSSSPTPQSDEIEVLVESDVPGVFSRLVGILDVRIAARARATIEVPANVRALTPLALRCDRDFRRGCDPWGLGSQVNFRWWERDRDDSEFHPLALSGITQANFESYLSCDIAEPGPGCYAGDVGLGSERILDFEADALEDALDSTGSAQHLVAVFEDDPRGRNVDLVGWAVLTVTGVTSGGPPRDPWVQIRGRFGSLLVPGTGVSSDGSGGAPYDFGVRAVALTG